MQHLESVLLPFRAESQELRGVVEFEVCYGSRQVHHCLERFWLNHLRKWVDAEEVHCSHL